MSTLWAIGIVGLLFLLVLAILGSIVLLRIRTPHSREMAAEQAKMNRKTGAVEIPKTPTPQPSRFTKVWGLASKNIWTILLSIVWLALLWWLHKGNLTIAKAAEWVWANLLFTLVATAIVTAFSDRLFPSKKMWWIPAAIVAGLLVTHWANRPPSPKAPLTFTMSPGGRTPLIPANRKHVVMDGDNFLLHNVYRDGHECVSTERCKDGPLTGVYATNLDMIHQNTVTVSYK